MSRRSIVGLLFFAAVMAAVVAAAIPRSRAPRERWTPIAIDAAAVPLNASDPTQDGVGPFAYAGGVVLTSTHSDRLHGLSDLEVTGADGLTAVSDEGVLLTARLVLDASGRLVGVTD